MAQMQSGQIVKIQGRSWRLEISQRGYVELHEAGGDKRVVTRYMTEEIKIQLRDDIDGYEAELTRLTNLAIDEARTQCRKSR